jgi:transposase
MLRQHAIQIEDLKAEVAELRERLSQNSRNSSLPPSSDPLSHQRKLEKRPTGRLRGAQAGHQRVLRSAVAKEKIQDAERARVGVCREDTNGGDNAAAARARCLSLPNLSVLWCL